MSVTFYPTGLEPQAVDHPVDCDGMNGLCEQYGCYDVIEVGLNVSQDNAVSILSALDLNEHLDAIAGEIEADELIGRCLAALAFANDAELPAGKVERFGPLGGIHLVDSGRRAGYMTDRLIAVLAIAEQAKSLGVTISWA